MRRHGLVVTAPLVIRLWEDEGNGNYRRMPRISTLIPLQINAIIFTFANLRCGEGNVLPCVTLGTTD
jgi:hypothetical protein